MVTARVLASIDGGRHVVLMNNGRRVKVRLQSDEPVRHGQVYFFEPIQGAKRSMTLPQDGRLPDWSGFMPAMVLSFAANSVITSQ